MVKRYGFSGECMYLKNALSGSRTNTSSLSLNTFG